MSELLQLTLKRINAAVEPEVAFVDFYDDSNECRITPDDYCLTQDCVDEINRLSVHLTSPHMRNKADYREIICVVENGYFDNSIPDSIKPPLGIVFIRYPLSVYGTLPNHKIWGSMSEWSPVFKYETLLDYTLLEFLIECSKHFPNPNFELAIQRAGDSYLSYMKPWMSEEYRANFNRNFEDPEMIPIVDARNWLLHSDLNMISFQRYEKQEIASEYIISSYDVVEQLNLQVRFIRPISIKDYKTFRKLLQIANSKESMLVGTVSHAFGFINSDHPDLHKDYNNYSHPTFISIRFLGVSDWEVSKMEQGERVPLMKSVSFRYQYPIMRYSEEQIKAALDKLPNCDMNAIIQTVKMVVEEKQGTMLIISTGAKQEADRLSDCCIQINPTQYSSIKMNVTAIDGAILCDPAGTCHAIGLILDGVHKNGNGETISRGARHNSAMRYSKWQKYLCVIVIVSEDGDVTIIP